jgi:REP element-mobilizing transposase RayT
MAKSSKNNIISNKHKFNPQVHHRRSIRLKGYDYTQAGAYFFTTVTQNRKCCFGRIIGNEMVLSTEGTIAQQAWLDLPDHYPHVQLDKFCIMPNHVHGIIVLVDMMGRGGSEVGNGIMPDKTQPGLRSLPDHLQTRPYRHGLPEIVRAFKSFSARRINGIRHTPGIPVWQRNYYEHIVRNEPELNRIRQYIDDNPWQWANDHENPDRKG